MTDNSAYRAEVPTSDTSSEPARSGLSLRRARECKYNCRIKYYPNEEDPVEVIISDEYVFNPDGWESVNGAPGGGRDYDIDDGRDGVPLAVRCNAETGEVMPGSERGFRRARRQAYDYVRANPSLDAFVTLTLDGNVIDRTDYGEIIRRLGVWLDNRVRRNGLRYIICPEYHADGKAIHFHGLMNFDALRCVNSGHRRKGKTVYNIADYELGFSTVIRVTGEAAQARCAAYVFKYMTKQMESRIGGRFYLHGGALDVPKYVYLRVKNPQIYDEALPPVVLEHVGVIRCGFDPAQVKLTVSGLLKGETE